MTGREYSFKGKLKKLQARNEKREKRIHEVLYSKCIANFIVFIWNIFRQVLTSYFCRVAFFYYVFKFEQTPTYYARLDVVVLREFYPTFDSITIFAELPLGQGIFFLCCSK